MEDIQAAREKSLNNEIFYRNVKKYPFNVYNDIVIALKWRIYKLVWQIHCRKRLIFLVNHIFVPGSRTYYW